MAVTMFVPTGKKEPDAGEYAMVVPEQLSVAEAVKKTRALGPGVPGSTMGHATIFVGQMMFGFSASITVTVKLQLVLLPAPSVAVQMTVVVPFGKLDPDGGEKLIFVTPEHVSDAEAV